jgi:hypothetical protein
VVGVRRLSTATGQRRYPKSQESYLDSRASGLFRNAQLNLYVAHAAINIVGSVVDRPARMKATIGYCACRNRMTFRIREIRPDPGFAVIGMSAIQSCHYAHVVADFQHRRGWHSHQGLPGTPSGVERPNGDGARRSRVDRLGKTWCGCNDQGDRGADCGIEPQRPAAGLASVPDSNDLLCINDSLTLGLVALGCFGSL